MRSAHLWEKPAPFRSGTFHRSHSVWAASRGGLSRALWLVERFLFQLFLVICAGSSGLLATVTSIHRVPPDRNRVGITPICTGDPVATLDACWLLKVSDFVLPGSRQPPGDRLPALSTCGAPKFAAIWQTARAPRPGVWAGCAVFKQPAAAHFELSSTIRSSTNVLQLNYFIIQCTPAK